MLRKTICILITLSVMMPLYAATTVKTASPWDHNGSEISTPVTVVPGSSPITYSSAFTREREMFGYNPRFLPTIVTFDKNNRPYMFTSLSSDNTVGSNTGVYDQHFITDTAFIQTLDDNGNWITYDLDRMVRDLYHMTQYVDPEIMTGFKYEDRLAFDDDNNIYLTINESNYSGKAIFMSRDGMETVEKIDLPYIYSATLESYDTFLSTERYLPTISYYHGTGLAFAIAELKQDCIGNISFDEAIDLSPSEGTFSPYHSGYLNHTVTVGDTVHCVWLDAVNQSQADYTNQYYSSYNRSTGEATAPVLLGSTFGNWYGDNNEASADPHNGPTITVDRDKTLHVVLGGHGSQAKYTYSTDAGKTWSTPVDMPGENVSNTYPTLLTDRENTLHLVYRATRPNGASGYRLSYSRKKAGQDWEDMGALIVPGNVGYSVYYHKMTVDRLGRLFVSYYYRAMTLSSSEIAEYEAKWPNEPSPALDDSNSRAHDTCILMSDDGGDTWRLATTQDFANGIIDDTVPVAYYNFDDSADLQKDISGKSNDLETVSGEPVAVAGKVGQAAGFDGVDDGFAGAFDQEKTFADGAFTVAGWFKLDSVSSSLGNLVHAKNGGNRGFALYVKNGQWAAFTYADGYYDSAIGYAATPINEWVHVAFTYAPNGSADSNGVYNGTIKVYVDGELKATATNKKYCPAGTTDIAVAMSSLGGGYFGCSVDDLAVFSGAMPQAKIAELASNEYSPFNVTRELILEGDFNEDGVVDSSDLMEFCNQWLN